MKKMLKEAAILFCITLISGCLLGLVYDVTKEPIAEAKAKAEQEACQEVFADATSFAEVGWTTGTVPTSITAAESDYGTTIDKVMAAQDASGNVLGYVITVTNHEGYGGDIQFSVGIRNDGTVNGVSILDIAETAGLGMKADPVLKDQFVNKNVAQFVTTKTGATGDDQIDAISGATITSDAFVRGANAALNHFQAIQADPTIAVILPDNPEEGGNGNE